MQDIFSKTDQRFLAVDEMIFLIPAANLNRPIKTVTVPRKA